MDYGVCLLSVVPCRAEANNKSEMVTQLLFGDLVAVQTENGNWLKVKTLTDEYIAWVDRQQIQEISEDLYRNLQKSKIFLTEDLITPVLSVADGQVMPIVLGSKLYSSGKNKTNYYVGKFEFRPEGSLRPSRSRPVREKLVEDAFLYLNAPYLWGGKSPLGIDCSAFVQMVYTLNGISLPRDAYQQAELGNTLSFIEEAEEGDLAFFDNKEGRIIHVGIMLKDHRIIHASGKVRIDHIDHQGIFRKESNDYSHRLRIIKKVI